MAGSNSRIKGNIIRTDLQLALALQKDSTEFLHTGHFILVDKSKRIRGIYNGTLTLEMQQLIEDIKTLEDEK